MASIKRYFHRLFPRAEGGQFYCNVILATTKAPAIIQDAMAVHLRDNRMGLWRRSINVEQVSKIGWLLYSTHQQDEKRISRELSTLTGEKIGARWQGICTTTNARKQNPTAVKPTEIRAIHLECDSVVLQHAKNKVANLYKSSATSFPDGTKMCLIPPIGTINSQASKEKYGLVVARQAAFTSKFGTGSSWEFSQNLLPPSFPCH